MSNFDQKVSEYLYHKGTNVPRIYWKILEYTGDGLVWLTIVFVALSLPATTSTARHLWANLLAGLLIDLIEVGILKGLVKRPRPQHNSIAKDMNVIVAVDHYSFPSGHSSRVSFIFLYAATILRYSTYDSHMLFLALCIGVWALVVALSRCVMGRHYVTDVLAGLLVGVVTLAILTQGTFDKARLVVPRSLVDTMYGEFVRWIGLGSSTFLT